MGETFSGVPPGFEKRPMWQRHPDIERVFEALFLFAPWREATTPDGKEKRGIE